MFVNETQSWRSRTEASNYRRRQKKRAARHVRSQDDKPEHANDNIELGNDQ